MSLPESFKDSLKGFDKPAAWYVEIAGYLIAGFIVGFLIKYGGRLFFLLLLGALIALWTLDYLNVVTVHYDVLKQMLGVSKDLTLAEFLTLTSAWIRGHLVESLSAFFGFVLAWKFA